MRNLELAVNDMVFTAIASGPDDGDLVLLLHGFPQTCVAWAAQVEALGHAGWHAVAPDIRGFTDGARPELGRNTRGISWPATYSRL